jgi:hypothetical protein
MLLLLTMVVFASYFMLSALPVSANPGLTLVGANIDTSVSPGDTFTHVMTVSIGASDPATQVQVTVCGVQQNQDGTLELLDAAHDTASYSARSFVTLDKDVLNLVPGVPQTVTATIQIPQNVGNGGRYAAINFATQPTGTGQVKIVTDVYVPVYLTIEGSQLIQTGKITELTTGGITTGQPINILTDLQNTGNLHFKFQCQITLKEPNGQIVDTTSSPFTAASILPGVTMQVDTPLSAIGSLAPGTYTIDSEAIMENGSVLDQATSTFKVGTEYVPPPVIGTIKLIPTSASMLKNADGTILINFPLGAAIIPVEVSIQADTVNQLPALPSGITAASCFQVNGLTGLLAQNATVNVKYTAADLSLAGGDAAKLRLARWDEGISQWALLKTSLDKGTMTLSTTSNEMGTWAVVVGAATSEINWTIIVIIIATVVVVGLITAFTFYTIRKMRKER